MTSSDDQLGDAAEPTETQGPGRNRAVLIVGAIVAVVAVVIGALVISGDETEDAAVPSTSTGATVPTTNESSVPSSTVGTDDTEPTSSTEVPSSTAASGSSATTVPQAPTDTVDSEVGGSGGVAIPVPPDVQPTESAACVEVKDGIIEYRALAVSSPIDDFLLLQLSLAEYESVADFVGDGQDWAVRMVELLQLVRRDWSTAYAADGSGDDDVVEERLASALESLDEAIAVPCPED